MKHWIIWIWLGLMTSAVFAIPRQIEVQGRLMSTDGITPLTGTELRNFLVTILPVSQNAAPIVTVTREITNVTVENGQFQFILDLSDAVAQNLAFDQPYQLRVAVGPRQGGGRVGDMSLSTRPYAFTADNALTFASRPPSAYITAHSHDRLNVSSFAIDGSRETRSNLDQFLIRNSVRVPSDTVFRINEDGELRSLGGMTATSLIQTRQGFQVRNGSELRVILDNLGDMSTPTTVAANLSVASAILVTGSLVNTPQATNIFSEVTITGILSLSTGSSVTGANLGTKLGQTHTLEQHLTEGGSTLLSALTTMLAGNLADELHTHVFNNREVKSLPNNLVDSARIRDGEITGDKFSPQAGIQDSKLAQISSAGKILISALPSEVIQTGVNASFKNPLPATVTDFDALQSKAVSIVSTLDDRLPGAFELVTFKDRPGPAGSLFDYTLMSSGDLRYSRPSLPNTSFTIESPDNKVLTYLRGVNTKISPVGFFGGSVIANSTVSDADFANSTISTLAIADGEIQGADLQDSAVGVNALGVLTGNAFATATVLNSRIAGLSVTDSDIAIGAINANLIENEGVGFADIVNRTLQPAKLALLSIDKSRFSSAANKALLAEDFADRSIGVSKLSSEASRTIDVSKISTEVFSARTQPVRITSSSSTQVVTIRDTTFSAYNYNGTANPVFLSLKLPQFVASTTGNPLEAKSPQGVVFAFRNDNHLQLSYTSGGNLIPVTVAPEAMAVLAGVPTPAGFCGNKDSLMRPLNTTLGASLRSADCISTTRNHGLGDLTYPDAVNTCAQNGYRVCSAAQLHRACRQGLIEKQRTYMTGAYAGNGRIGSLQVANNDNRCAVATTDYSVTSIADNTSQSFYCCLR
jgi:hypothetical protein